MAVLQAWRELGFPFPCLGEILFDNTPFPREPDAAWRALYLHAWQGIADELGALDVQRIVGDD